MLATYLSVTLGLLFLLGITVGSMFQQQYIGEKEGELRREAEEINETVASPVYGWKQAAGGGAGAFDHRPQI